MDAATVSVYERLAGVYERNRPPVHAERARALAAGAAPGLPVLDLGCGPGGYGPHLAAAGHAVVGLDAAWAMVARARASEACVRGDLAALPFGPGTAGAAWARNTYLHLPAPALPLALAHLHRALVPGAPLALSMIAGGDFRSADDLPGRAFTGWEADHLARVVAGAGFEEVAVEEAAVETAAARGRALWATARRARSLPDTVGPGMRLLVCGLNPSLVAADAGVGFAGPSNRFWKAAVAAGLVDRPRDPWRALAVGGVGMTDLVKRATARAGVLGTDEFRSGVQRVAALVAWLRPAAVCLVGLQGWRAAVDRRAAAGWQAQGLGGVPTYVMPSTSGLNAHTSLADCTAHLRAAQDPPVQPEAEARPQEAGRRLPGGGQRSPGRRAGPK